MQDLPEFLHKTALPSGAWAPASDISLSCRPNTKSLREALKNPEEAAIRNALEQVGWNRKEAAAMLGINRTTLYNKMKSYDLLKKRSAIKGSLQ